MPPTTLLLAALISPSCSDSGPQLTSGQYEVTVTNLEDGCALPGWFEGDTFDGSWDVDAAGSRVFVRPRWQGTPPPWGFPTSLDGYRDDTDDHFSVGVSSTCEACACNDSLDFTMDAYAMTNGSLSGTVSYNVQREDSGCSRSVFCQAAQRFVAK